MHQMNSPSSSLTPNDQHWAEMARLWNQITDKHAVDALMKFAAEEAAASLPFADRSILSHPPMELTDEEKNLFSAMWDNVPSENVVHLSQEEYDKFVDKLNNPPVPNEALKKAFTDAQSAEGMQQLWQHSENYLQQLKHEVSKSVGIPKHLGDIDPRNATVV
jgi:oligoribonuclease NrnB/cAMP/cGMP phosphodiesterase (DHH superfamily)